MNNSLTLENCRAEWLSLENSFLPLSIFLHLLVSTSSSNFFLCPEDCLLTYKWYIY